MTTREWVVEVVSSWTKSAFRPPFFGQGSQATQGMEKAATHHTSELVNDACTEISRQTATEMYRKERRLSDPVWFK